jgi:type III secretion protein C
MHMTTLPIPSRRLRRAARLLLLALAVLAAGTLQAATNSATLNDIRHRSEPGHTRVVLDVSAPVDFAQALGEKSGARQLLVTLRGAAMAPGLRPTRAVGDGIVSSIQASVDPPAGVTVALDLVNMGRHRVFSLTDPDRVVIDLYTAAAAPPTPRTAQAYTAAMPMAPMAAGGGFSKPFSYYADQQDLPTVLMHFARSQGLGASISPAVSGKVSGRFSDVPPDKFLQGMHAAFGVSWYRLGSSLQFYNDTETTRAFITPRSMTAERLHSMLQQSAVFSPQLPPTLAPDGNMLVVPARRSTSTRS